MRVSAAEQMAIWFVLLGAAILSTGCCMLRMARVVAGINLILQELVKK